MGGDGGRGEREERVTGEKGMGTDGGTRGDPSGEGAGRGRELGRSGGAGKRGSELRGRQFCRRGGGRAGARGSL